MTSTTLPASTGVVSSYTYGIADRLTAISHVKGATTLASVAYTLDAVGNRTQRVDQEGTHTYSYDNLYRLTSVDYPGPDMASYYFDAFGNRTSMTNGSGTTNYAYDNADRITSVTLPGPTVTSYTWDDNGNLTNRGADTFAWDVEDRMTSATVGGTTTTFAYRGDGLRAIRTAGGVTTNFTWDINAGLPVVLDDGAQYLYGAGLEAMKQSGSWFYYLADGLGSTMAIVNASGTVQNSYAYDVYGKPTVTGSLPNEYDFAGQQTDATGLQYLRARYMDPETGSFASREPMAEMPSWTGSPTGYAAGNPAMMVDPSGLYPGESLVKGGKKVGGAIVEGAKTAVHATTEFVDKHGAEMLGACASGAIAGAVVGAVQSAMVGAATGGGITGVAVASGAAIGCAAGAAATLNDDPRYQCLVGAAAALSAKIGGLRAAGACIVAVLGSEYGNDDDPGTGCLAAGLGTAMAVQLPNWTAVPAFLAGCMAEAERRKRT
jgi:RHS repeat-associated protein